MKNYIILHYALDFKYGDHSLFTGVFVTNYTNKYYAMARRNWSSILHIKLFACGDTEVNPGPKKKGAPATISQFAIEI